LGEKIKEATIQKWHVQEGDVVEELQTLADVSTDKLFTPIPASYSGKIHKIHVIEGNDCEVGQLLLEMEVEEGLLSEEDLYHAKPDSSKSKGTESDDKAEVTEENKEVVQGEKAKSAIKNTIVQELSDVLCTPAVRGLAKR